MCGWRMLGGVDVDVCWLGGGGDGLAGCVSGARPMGPGMGGDVVCVCRGAVQGGALAVGRCAPSVTGWSLGRVGVRAPTRTPGASCGRACCSAPAPCAAATLRAISSAAASARGLNIWSKFASKVLSRVVAL